MAGLNFDRKLQLVKLKDHQHLSYRQTSQKTGIPKSTIHDNINQFRKEAEAFNSAINADPVERLVRTTLILAMNGKCSTRDTASTISLIWNTMVSQQTILKILNLSATVAKELNKKVDLKPVQSGLFDEVFQNSLPLLVFADSTSGVIGLKAPQDRSGDSWEGFLKDLKKLGLNPDTIVTDGGTGLLKGIKEVFGSATLVRDLFHVLQKLGKAARVMERFCYNLLGKSYEFKAKNDIAGAKDAMDKFDEAATLFDVFEKPLKEFKLSCTLAHPDSDKGYVESGDLLKIIVSIQESLYLFKEKFCRHKAIKDAWSYLKNGAQEIVAYKKTIEVLVERAFGPRYEEMVRESFCPFIEYIHRYMRAHDSVAEREFWGKKIVELRQRFRSYTVADQDEVDNAINMIWAVGLKSSKSNSFIETVNSVIRRYLNTYNSIPCWFCPIFTLFWNNRKFARGKRAKMSPKQLLSGNNQSDWVEKIIEKFPLEKLRSSIPAIPGYFNPEWDRANRKPNGHRVQILRVAG